MSSVMADLALRLADEAEAVCRHYLSNGHRVGQYWLVGDARNTPGRSLYVRLAGAAASRGRAGKWTDAATAVRRRMIWNRRPDFEAESSGSSV